MKSQSPLNSRNLSLVLALAGIFASAYAHARDFPHFETFRVKDGQVSVPTEALIGTRVISTDPNEVRAWLSEHRISDPHGVYDLAANDPHLDPMGGPVGLKKINQQLSQCVELDEAYVRGEAMGHRLENRAAYAECLSGVMLRRVYWTKVEILKMYRTKKLPKLVKEKDWVRATYLKGIADTASPYNELLMVSQSDFLREAKTLFARPTGESPDSRRARYEMLIHVSAIPYLWFKSHELHALAAATVDPKRSGNLFFALYGSQITPLVKNLADWAQVIETDSTVTPEYRASAVARLKSMIADLRSIGLGLQRR